MRLNRLPASASTPVPPGGHRLGAGLFRAVSVTIAAGAVCALAVLPASAATAAPHVAKHSTKTSVSVSPKTAYSGARVRLSAKVKSAGKTPTGSVTFRWGHTKLCAAKLSKGSTHCYAKFTGVRGYTIKASYSGNSSHKASSGTAHLTIKAEPATAYATTTQITAPNPIASQASGLPYTIKVAVTSSGGGTPTGTVAVAPINLTDPGPTYSCTATLGTNGTGSCVVTPPAGAYGFTLFQATYSGDAKHKPSATSVNDEHKLINPDTTKTTVAPNTGTAGDAMTLTATVVDQANADLLAGYSTSPDTVTFTVGGVDIAGCVAVPISYTAAANIATCSYTPPTATTYAIAAAYSGDDYNFPSTGTETLTVGS